MAGNDLSRTAASACGPLLTEVRCVGEHQRARTADIAVQDEPSTCGVRARVHSRQSPACT